MTEQNETTSTSKIPIGVDADGNTVFWTPSIALGVLKEVLFIEDEVQSLLRRPPGKSDVTIDALRNLVRMGRLQPPAPDGEPAP